MLKRQEYKKGVCMAKVQGNLIYYTAIATEQYSTILNLAGEALKVKYGVNWREAKNSTIDAEVFEFFLDSIVAQSLQGSNILKKSAQGYIP